MTCFSCGTQIPDGSTVCPRCQGAQPDHSATNRVTQSTPEGVTPIYAYHAPPSFLSPSSSPPAPFKKNRLRTILVAGGSATVLLLALMVFWLYTVETMLHHLSVRPSLTSGAPMTLNPYTKQNERGPRESDAAYLLRLVRDVRNNLFHGGKYPDGLVNERRLRNSRLLQACLTILEICLPLNADVQRFFEDAID